MKIPEHEASKWLKPKVEKYGTVVSKSIDRGYLAADWTSELYSQGKKVIAKPWNPATQGKYGKKDFIIDLQNSIVTCPAGQAQRITGKPGSFRAKYSSNEYDSNRTTMVTNLHIALNLAA